jgi:hypothetical protein
MPMSATREREVELALRKIVQGAAELDVFLADRRSSKADDAVRALAEKANFGATAVAASRSTGDTTALIGSAQDLLEQYCCNAPERALDLALASLERSVGMMSEIVDETRRDLVEIENRRRQIDRTQAQTRETLEDLLEEGR